MSPLIWKRLRWLSAALIILMALFFLGWHEFAFPEVHAGGHGCDGQETDVYHRAWNPVPGYAWKQGGNKDVVIFVHGIRDNGVDCWTNKENQQYWPALLAKQAPKWDVYVADYQDRISIGDVATVMSNADLGPVFAEHDHVVILAHSMGGLVARQFLIDNPALVTKVSAMFLLATPTLGSKVANIVARTGLGTIQLEQLRPITINAFLKDQIAKWQPYAQVVRTSCATETRRTWFFEVVDQTSASRLCDASTSIDAGHVSIAKPMCANARQARMLLHMLTALRLSPTSESPIIPTPTPHVLATELFVGLSPGVNEGIVSNSDGFLARTNKPIGYTVFSSQSSAWHLYVGSKAGVNAGYISVQSGFRDGPTQDAGYTLKTPSSNQSVQLFMVRGCGPFDGEVTTNSTHRGCPTESIGWLLPPS
jgi:pimeloyl-ACP methyl ester carboxylesterase